MKKFKFQLETLLKVTKMKKEEAEVALGKASRKLEEARMGLETLLAEMQKGQQDYDALSQEGTRVTIGRLMSFNSFFAGGSFKSGYGNILNNLDRYFAAGDLESVNRELNLLPENEPGPAADAD